MRTGRPTTKVIVNCANCGVEITKYQSDIERNKTGRFFCSITCRNIVGSKPKTGRMKPCEQCGTEFWVIPIREDVARFCSAECRDISNRVGTEVRECEHCRNEFDFNLKMRKWNAGRFCSRGCHQAHKVEQSIGRTKTRSDGYVSVRQPDHPNADVNGWVPQHHLVMEEALGRYLVRDAGENVHHINGDRSDNRLENLELWNTSQPAGQRVIDKVAWAKDLLALYEPESLAAVAH